MNQELGLAEKAVPIFTGRIADSLRAQLATDCDVMLRYAFASGRNVPIDLIDAFARISLSEIERPEELSALALLHGSLAQLVAPATPLGIRLVQNDENRHRALHVLGPVPSIRWLMIAAILCSLTFFGISLCPSINRQTLTRDIYDLSGVSLLIPLLFLLSAAGLGATFGALFEAYQFVSEGRFDARFDSIYWARIGLGLVSGLMLAELIPDASGSKLLARPLLALLGGFSGAVVHRILQRLVDGVESVFLADARNSTTVQSVSASAMVGVAQALDPQSTSRMLDRLLERGARAVTPSAGLSERAVTQSDSPEGHSGEVNEHSGSLEWTIRPGPTASTNLDGRGDRVSTPSATAMRYSRPANTGA